MHKYSFASPVPGNPAEKFLTSAIPAELPNKKCVPWHTLDARRRKASFRAASRAFPGEFI
ncbi:hypothetical protein C3V36_01415 [Lachnospiraceae bacterium oral taxon 500]|nr:hypothetical protein C3V36_01415 [Lachnospiraceae bacterium oral taxon 500]